MATGIIAVAAANKRSPGSPRSCTSSPQPRYIVLITLTVVRSPFQPGVRDRSDQPRQGLRVPHHGRRDQRAGQRVRVVHGWWDLAWILWWASLGLWAVLLYSTLIAVVLKGDKPDLGAGINGTWFLLTVSTESIAVLGRS
jgi:hypothetical protein